MLWEGDQRITVNRKCIQSVIDRDRVSALKKIIFMFSLTLFWVVGVLLIIVQVLEVSVEF